MNLQLTKLSFVFTLCATLWLVTLVNPAWATLNCDLTTLENVNSTGVIRPPYQFALLARPVGRIHFAPSPVWSLSLHSSCRSQTLAAWLSRHKKKQLLPLEKNIGRVHVLRNDASMYFEIRSIQARIAKQRGRGVLGRK
jgi:hypothetical protein